MRSVFIFLGLLFLMAGCYQTHDEDGLRAVPVTNNPHIIPQKGGGPMQAIPY